MDKCKDKKCPEKKICNPKSGRCVLISGSIGKKLLKNKRKSPKRKSPKRKSPKRKSPKRKSPKRKSRKPCKSNQIRNPRTGRCVLKSGKIGKELLKLKSPILIKKAEKKSTPQPKLKKEYSCQFNSDGICENILTSLKKSENCTYSKKEKRCIYSDKYNKKRKKDYILVLHTTKDHNNAFDADGDKGLFELLKKFTNFKFMYKKIDTKNTLKKVLDSLPKSSKIAKLIIMAHGTPNSFHLGNYIISDNNVSNFVELIKPKLSRNANILLHSCLVGKGGIKANNIANKMSILLPGIPVYGAENEIARNTLFVLSINDDFNRRNLKLEYMIDDPHKPNKIYKFYHPRK